jgi:hypothetical protein
MCFTVWVLYFKLHHIQVENPTNDDVVKILGWFFVLLGQAPAEAVLIFLPDSIFESPGNFTSIRVAFGMLVCLFALVIVLQKTTRKHFFLLSSLLFVFALCAAAARSRTLLTYSYAMSTQYHNWALLIICLLALAGLNLLPNNQTKFRVFTGLFVIFFTSNVAFWVSEWAFINAFKDYRVRSQEAFYKTGDLFKNAPTASDSQMVQRLKSENKPTNMMEDFFFPEKERSYKERILWRAHLYGAMPITEFLFESGVYFDHEKLRRIVGDISEVAPLEINNSTRVLGLNEENGRFRLLPLSKLASSETADGYIYLRDKNAMKKTGGWEVLKNPELFLKNQAFSSGERLFVVLANQDSDG